MVKMTRTRTATRDLSPAPAEVLSDAERRRATLWKIKWGTQCWTREPGSSLKTGEQLRLRPMEPAWVPLVEIGGRRTYTWLEFLAWRRDHEGFKP